MTPPFTNELIALGLEKAREIAYWSCGASGYQPTSVTAQWEPGSAICIEIDKIPVHVMFCPVTLLIENTYTESAMAWNAIRKAIYDVMPIAQAPTYPTNS